MNAEVLNSWKEIAAYMGRGVRTVQRWEQELGLPVRRPRGKERSAVIALKPDLDHWLQQVPQGASPGRPPGGHNRQNLQLNTERMVHRMQEIVERSQNMQETVKTTLQITSKLRDQLEIVRGRQAWIEAGSLAGTRNDTRRLAARKHSDVSPHGLQKKSISVGD